MKNVFEHGDRQYVLALLARVEDWRPLRAPWWRQTEVCVIGADQTGNFFLRHADGSVRYWDHATQTDAVIAESVRTLVAGLDWSEDFRSER